MMMMIRRRSADIYSPSSSSSSSFIVVRSMLAAVNRAFEMLEALSGTISKGKMGVAALRYSYAKRLIGKQHTREASRHVHLLLDALR